MDAIPTKTAALEGWTTIEQGITVAAPPECIESLLVDFRRIFPSLENIALDETFPDIGGSLTYSTPLGNLAVMEVVFTMLEWKPGFLLGDLAIHAVKLKTGGLAANRSTTHGSIMWLMAQEKHGTRVTARYQYEQPSTYFEQILEERVVRNLIAQSQIYTLNTIRRLAEARARA